MLVLVIGTASVPGLRVEAAVGTPVSVADAIRYAEIGDPGSLEPTGGYGQRLASFSPDNQYVAIVVRRGNPDLSINEAELRIYRTSDLLNPAPKPDANYRFVSRDRIQALADVQWTSDSKTLYFGAMRDGRLPQVFRIRIDATGKLAQVTQEREQLSSFSVSEDGAYLALILKAHRKRPEHDLECIERGCRVTARDIYSAEVGASPGGQMARYDLHTGKRIVIRPVERDEEIAFCTDIFHGGLSPDGRFGLRYCALRPNRWPGWWSDYTVDPELRDHIRRGLNAYARRFYLVDWSARSVRSLSDAPYAVGHMVKGAEPLWIIGGSRILLAGALEPLADVTGDERDRRVSTQAILAFDAMSGRYERVATLSREARWVSALRWNRTDNVVSVQAVNESGKPLSWVRYKRTDGAWTADADVSATDAAREMRLVDLELKQSINERPILMATSTKTDRKNPVLDPNVWLNGRQLGAVEAVEWSTNDGSKWKGKLYYPPDYDYTIVYPLVIQTHGDEFDHFSLSGAARSYVARPLAAKGIFVLEVTENSEGAHGPAEWPIVQAGYEAAIDFLVRRRQIDRGRVGIIGWSGTGPYVGYTLTHSQYRFAAAAFAPTADYGWWHMLATGSTAAESAYGVTAFGEGLKTWAEMAPSFNLERVNTPMMMWVWGSVTGLWDWYSGLRMLNKPVEYWHLPDGSHDVFKIGERLNVNMLFVDWFDFWLNDHQDTNPAKGEQYKRWREFTVQSLPDS